MASTSKTAQCSLRHHTTAQKVKLEEWMFHNEKVEHTKQRKMATSAIYWLFSQSHLESKFVEEMIGEELESREKSFVGLKVSHSRE